MFLIMVLYLEIEDFAKEIVWIYTYGHGYIHCHYG